MMRCTNARNSGLRLREFEMRQITDRREAPTPSQSQVGFCPGTYGEPEPLRNRITTHSQNVQIESTAINMTAAKSPTPTFADQGRLLCGSATRSECDDACGPSDISQRVDKVDRSPGDVRVERIDL